MDSLPFHYQPLDVSDDSRNFNASLLNVEGKDVFLLGETHGVAWNYDLDLALLKYLHKVAGVRVYLAEASYAVGTLFNEFIHDGDTSVLDRALGCFAHTLGWSKEHREFWRHVFEWNKSLDVAERIYAVGIDQAAQGQRKESLKYLLHLVGEKTAPPQLVELINSLKNVTDATEPSPNLGQELLVKFYRDSVKSDLHTLLKEDYFDFMRGLDSLWQLENSAFDFPCLKQRERNIHHNCLEILRTNPGAKLFGRWGRAHVVQRPWDEKLNPNNNCEHFAKLLNQAGSPAAGNVLSIWPLYEKSQRMSGEGNNRFFSVSCADDRLVVRHFSKVAKSPLTLFDIRPESPFSEGLSACFTDGQAYDNVQYVCLMRGAPAATPLQSQRVK